MRTAQTKFSAIEPEADAEVIKSSSDRSLGFVFATALGLLGAWPLIHGRPPRIWLVLLAAFFTLAAIYVPWMLQPLNVVWTRLGAVLHRIVSPIAMGVVFFLVVTPTAYLMRMLGKDVLRLARDTNARTYWIERNPPGPNPRSMERQF
jgi:saxitoxin biosynthesis operon SxtJ-like protein